MDLAWTKARWAAIGACVAVAIGGIVELVRHW